MNSPGRAPQGAHRSEHGHPACGAEPRPRDLRGSHFVSTIGPIPPQPVPAVIDTAPEPATGTEIAQPVPPAPVPGLRESGDLAARTSSAPFAASGTGESQPASEPGAPVATILHRSSRPSLVLILGQSRRLHLDRDASSVLAASPGVADVRLLAPDVVYVIGKGVGRTTVAVLDDNE